MSYKGRTIGEIYAEKRPGERQYDACMRLGCQERAKGGVECRELCERASPVLTRQPLPEGLVTRHRPRASAGVSANS